MKALVPFLPINLKLHSPYEAISMRSIFQEYGGASHKRSQKAGGRRQDAGGRRQEAGGRRQKGLELCIEASISKVLKIWHFKFKAFP